MYPDLCSVKLPIHSSDVFSGFVLFGLEQVQESFSGMRNSLSSGVEAPALC